MDPSTYELKFPIEYKPQPKKKKNKNKNKKKKNPSNTNIPNTNIPNTPSPNTTTTTCTPSPNTTNNNITPSPTAPPVVTSSHSAPELRVLPHFTQQHHHEHARYASVTRDTHLCSEIHNTLFVKHQKELEKKQETIPILAKQPESLSKPKAEEAPPPPDAQLEAVVLLEGRPSLLIRNGRFEIPRSGMWARTLSVARSVLQPRFASIGRVEIDDGITASRNAGTAWMIAPRIVATAGHVAEIFARRTASGKFEFLQNFLGTQVKVAIDFLEEYNVNNSLEISVEEVLYMRPDNQSIDVALLKLRDDPRMPQPLPLANSKVASETLCAIVGYPARDTRYGMDAIHAARSIFGDIYDVKRLSVGKVMETPEDKWYFLHDLTTLGGNSGSPVMDLKHGLVVGLHFSGNFKTANYAVHVKHVAKILKELGQKPLAPPVHLLQKQSDDDDVIEESVDKLSDRAGYNEKFLGESVALPKVTRDDDMVYTSRQEFILRYTHFSVVICKSRRLCWFSAVNIDGNQSVSIKGKRPSWKFDSRIPQHYQIKGECYGNEREGKFSRGHMTRREDPNWGKDAKRANSDTFYVTNAVPQMQPFNAGIWMGLEDYALEHAKQDDMKISVFTGPVLASNDPEFFGVKVPVQFWKIIVFRHDQTGKLTATGYLMSQRDFLPGEEFVFGRHEVYQTAISTIEELTTLSFGNLSKLDPFRPSEGPQEESVPVPVPAKPLQSLDDIVYFV